MAAMRLISKCGNRIVGREDLTEMHINISNCDLV